MKRGICHRKWIRERHRSYTKTQRGQLEKTYKDGEGVSRLLDHRSHIQRSAEKKSDIECGERTKDWRIERDRHADRLGSVSSLTKGYRFKKKVTGACPLKITFIQPFMFSTCFFLCRIISNMHFKLKRKETQWGVRRSCCRMCMAWVVFPQLNAENWWICISWYVCIYPPRPPLAGSDTRSIFK